MHAEPHTELVIDSKIEVVTHLREPAHDVINREEQWEHLISLKNEAALY